MCLTNVIMLTKCNRQVLSMYSKNTDTFMVLLAIQLMYIYISIYICILVFFVSTLPSIYSRSASACQIQDS